MHTNYQPARKGLIDSQIIAAKAGVKVGPDAFGYFYGGRKGFSKAFLEAMEIRQGKVQDMLALYHQRLAMRYSDRGDFTRCYRGGF